MKIMKNGKERDYLKEVEDFEQLAVKPGMNERQALEAKVNVLDNALNKGIYPETKNEEEAKIVNKVSKLHKENDFRSFCGLERLNYYREKLAGMM